MNNPFFSYSAEEKCEYLTPLCSLNKAVVAKVPVKGIDDSIQGKLFREIFSTQLIIDEMKSLAHDYGVDISSYEDSQLPKLIDSALISNDIKIRQLAQRVVVKFGNRLGLLLLTLKLGQQENKNARPDWDERHWNYWNKVHTVIFAGGLSSGMLGRRFKEQIHYVFDVADVKPYNIVLFDNGTYVGIMGCAQRLMEDGETALVLDLGHTNIKRCIVKKRMGELTEVNALESKQSLYMSNSPIDKQERLNVALKLHKYLVKIIADTYREQSRDYELSQNIIISIASYTSGGVLNNKRGGYAKLRGLGDNYSKILSEDLSGELHKGISVRLIHDGTANALYFSNIENSVCISLGTAFGVGFPDITI